MWSKKIGLIFKDSKNSDKRKIMLTIFNGEIIFLFRLITSYISRKY